VPAADARDAAAFADQARDRGLGADFGSRLLRGVYENLVECHAANVEDRGTGHRDDVVEDGDAVVEDHPAAQHRGRDLEQRIEDPDPLKHLDAVGLDPVGRGCVAREPVLVDHADLEACAGQHRGQRRAGAAGTDDDHVESLSRSAHLANASLWPRTAALPAR